MPPPPPHRHRPAQALIQLADTKVSVKGIQGHEAATKKALTSAQAKFVKWATENKGAEFAQQITITFDPNSLKSGVGT